MKKSHVTIHDIAKELGVTASTISRALQNNPRISKETREAVHEMAKQMNYQPNTVAANLRKGRGNTLGVIIPWINRGFFSNIIGSIETIANEHGFNTIICQSHESYKKELENIQTLLNVRVDGILMSLSVETKDYSHIYKIIEQNVSLIMFDRVVEDDKINKVIVDDYNGAFQAVEHLVKQGRKRIAYLGGPLHVNIYKNRFSGYKDVLSKHGIGYSEEMVVVDALTKERGIEEAKRLMKLPDPPDAIFAASDFSALGSIMYLKEQGLSVPEKVAVVGFGNEPFTEYLNPSLTSVSQNPNRIGDCAANMFFDQINNESDKVVRAQSVVLDSELIVRESSLY